MAKKKTTGKSASGGKRSAKKAGSRSAAGKKKPAAKRGTKDKAKARSKSKPKNNDVVVVGIGASAGGLEALDDLFKSMPIDSGLAFVVVTHQHPGHTSLLPELLGKETEMSVIPATDGAVIEPNHIYVGPPGGTLAIMNGVLHRIEAEKKEAPRLPIDYFFRSLAEDKQDKAIGIVLSGTGSDGTLGIKVIKGESGMVMVQLPQSAKYAGMPSSAIATGLADYVMTPADIPKQLIAYSRGPYLQGAAVAAEKPSLPIEPMQKIFLLLRQRTGNDFSSYKSSTLRRRIERRMNVHQIVKPTQYVRYLQDNPHEIDLLFRELLISVTNFFRDPKVWTALADKHLEELLKSRPEEYSFRAWVPGCATGEEAYSLAITMRESMERLERHMDVQIFGTDLDHQAIDLARQGRYPDGIASDVSLERLRRYFVHADSSYRIRNDIRETTIFATQNIIKDPPFTRLDMISCRNLLIYLNSDLQKRLLPIFHYALKPGGLLLLGPSETVGAFTDLFEVVDKRWKIFRRKENVGLIHGLPDMPAQLIRVERDLVIPANDSASVKKINLPDIIEHLLLDRFAPASVVVNDRGDILYFHGHTGSYLEPAVGRPSNNVLAMAREGLQIDLASALRQAVATGNDVVCENVRVKTNSKFTKINFTVSKIKEPEAAFGLFLVTFFPSPSVTDTESEAGKKKTAKSGDNEKIDNLGRELQFTRESLQSTVEELETSNEELKSTNEELQSTNEELQSTNEELETSKEEMQSLNEELTTVNAELESKVEELSDTNNDMQNLLNSTEIATIFLDNEFRVQRYTDQAKNLINLIQTDIGRPIDDLKTKLKLVDIVGSCREVLRTLESKEEEVETNDGIWQLMRIRPYRTTENVIEGIVLTFVDIDELKQLERSDNKQLLLFESIVDTMREPLLVLDEDLHVANANQSFYRVFKTSSKQTVGEFVYELGGGQWDTPDLRKLLEETLKKNQSFDDYEVEAKFPRIGRRVFALNARRLEQKSGLAGMIVLAFEDITNP